MPDLSWLYDATDPAHCLWCQLAARQQDDHRIAAGQQILLGWLHDQARPAADAADTLTTATGARHA